MSFSNPRFNIPRLPISVTGVEGEAGEFVKMFDPPTDNPPLPEALNPTNPVPEVMEAIEVDERNLLDVSRARTVQRRLSTGQRITTWDNRSLEYFLFRDSDLDSRFDDATYPAATIRVPRGVIFHCEGQGSQGPHTIHWHGLEPTPQNDGVGHCSMEIGSYIYQLQPNHTGSYFYHCHRNTMQHFEFGLFGLFLVEPPDAYFASVSGSNWRTQTIPNQVVFNNIPVGACSDGRFRTEANLLTLPLAVRNQFPGFVGGDPVFGVATPTQTLADMNPHAFTVPYDVEAVWVFDDRDINWSNLASNVRQTFPVHGAVPGEDDDFFANNSGFFAFNDFRASHWFVTGVPVPTLGGPTPAAIDPAGAAPRGGGLPGGVIPRWLMSGKENVQVAVNAQVGQTILIRALDAAYNSTRITFPVDVVIIAWDGRGLGVPPFGVYSQATVVRAGTPILISTARRFDAIVRATVPIQSNVRVEFLSTQGGALQAVAHIPFRIS
jgi:hypothetical protein